MPKSLVTGGAGFIGSNLVDELIRSGHEVVCVDDESSGSMRRNMLASNHKADVCDLSPQDPMFRGVDFIFHLAAESRIGASLENPVRAYRTNVLGTVNMLNCARLNGVRRFMYSSTSAAYGRNPRPNVETQPDDCLNPYASSKVAGEKACLLYRGLFGLEAVVFRYFNVYGPGEPRTGLYAPVMGIFARQRNAGQSLTVVGDGLQRRDFTHVADVVRANILASLSDLASYEFGSVLNVGSGRNHSVLDLAMMISDDVSFVPERPGEMRETLADNSKIRAVLGWEPTVILEDYVASLA